MSSTNTVRRHPVYRSLNRPLRILGVERRMFFLVVAVSGAAFNLFESLLTGLLMFAVLYAPARWAAGNDPAVVKVLLNSSRMRAAYDPARLDWRRR